MIRAICTLLLFLSPFVAQAAEADRPNIVVILADDFGAEASALYPALSGNTGQVSTPTIQALAQNGLVFDTVWASPVCSPTRAALLSGLYGHQTGVTNVGNVLDVELDLDGLVGGVAAGHDLLHDAGCDE